MRIEVLTELGDFKKVYRVFSGPPYFEKYEEEELEKIFIDYKKCGAIYGAYDNEDCVGLVALERGAKPEHPVTFQTDKVIYLADVAVVEEYRRRGIGNQLMIWAVMESKTTLGGNVLYMRTLKEGSMSESVARKIGFKQIPDAYQSVTRENIDGSSPARQNIFLKIDLNSLDRESMQAAITMAIPSRDNEEIEK